MEQTSEQQPPLSPVMPIAWFLAAALGTLVAAAVVGFFGYHSESAGVNAAMIAGFPVGALWSGFLAGLVVHLLKKRHPAARIALPLGCGALGGLFFVGLVAFFFFAIFPAL